MTFYQHHIWCNAMPDQPYESPSCQCWWCSKCQLMHMKTGGEKVCNTSAYSSLAEYAKADAAMTAKIFMMGNGKLIPLPLQPKPVPPCPECGGAATTLTQTHKMSCDGYWNLCPVCWEWAHVSDTPHKCKPKKDPQPRVRPAFDIPPAKRPNRWFVEYRYKRHVWEAMASDNGPDGLSTTGRLQGNVWRQQDRGTTSWPTECMARNEVARLRRRFPGKSYRYRGKYVDLSVR
jgi:hypothetical protein